MHMELGILQEIVTLFMLSIVVVLLCHRVRIPSIVAFLITGVLCGPSALGLVKDIDAVNLIAEVGVAFLLFTIGMELSRKELKRLRKQLLIGGTGQVLITVAVVSLITFYFIGFAQSIVVGCLVALSSTAIVLSLLQRKAQTESPQGRTCIGVLIFQDIAIVPMILLFPLLSGTLNMSLEEGFFALGKSVLILGSIFLFGKFILPKLMLSVMRTRSRDLMIMTSLGLCLAVALVTASLGLSLSLGAFLAGLLLAESDYSLSVLENVLPFKEVFTSIFFISVGMLLDIPFFLEHFGVIILITGFIILLKALILIPVVRLTGYPMRTAIIAALYLAQVGEFSFVLAKSALSLNLLDNSIYQVFLAASIISMSVTPVLMSIAPSLATWLLRNKDIGLAEGEDAEKNTSDHIIIIGFGVGGKILAYAAKDVGIPYVISEMNPDTVTKYRNTEPIYHGDASFPTVLEHLGAARAKLVVVMVSDPVGVHSIVQAARIINPSVYIIVRTRFLSDVGKLMELGADQVIPEEFETSVEVFASALNHFLVPKKEIEHYINKVREENYNTVRSLRLADSHIHHLTQKLPHLELSSYVVEENSPIEHETLGSGILRQDYHVTVAAVCRDDEMLTRIEGNTIILKNDIVYLFGRAEDLIKSLDVFKSRNDLGRIQD